MSFQDQWSRWHHKAATPPSKYGSNNGWIYSAEADVVGLEVDPALLYMCYAQSVTEFGFKRHPDQPSSDISHDEIIGLAYLFGKYNRALMQELIKQWESQHWQICDLKEFKPKPYYKINWIAVVKALLSVYRLDKQYQESAGARGFKARHGADLYPVLLNVTRKMNGWKRYLIKKHAGIKPSLFESVYFFLSKLVTIYNSSGHNSSKRILGFQLLMLKQNKSMYSFFDKVLEKLFFRKYNLNKIASDEYRFGHPILQKIKV